MPFQGEQLKLPVLPPEFGKIGFSALNAFNGGLPAFPFGRS